MQCPTQKSIQYCRGRTDWESIRLENFPYQPKPEEKQASRSLILLSNDQNIHLKKGSRSQAPWVVLISLFCFSLLWSGFFFQNKMCRQSCECRPNSRLSLLPSCCSLTLVGSSDPRSRSLTPLTAAWGRESEG